ncbi:MAG: YgiQ family radical SAM protein [Pseudomonadales bacterium]|nr:YgiQ family radical SAM protein [Pseudomonadales bacterium]
MSDKKAEIPQQIFDYRPYWAECFGVAPFLPTSREEMDQLGWDSCDVIVVTGDAYVDHVSFGMAVIGRVLEAQGFRVGIIDQPDWTSAQAFKKLGKPNLYFGVAAGNMDSMINRYTADRRIRHDDAYTPGNIGGKRPDRAVIVYSQRCREAYKDVPVVIGSIEASLRRIAHFDYWSEKVRRSILLDSKADMLLYGNAERAIIELTHRLAAGESLEQIRNIRGTAFMLKEIPDQYRCIDASTIAGDINHEPSARPANTFLDDKSPGDKRSENKSSEVIVSDANVSTDEDYSGLSSVPSEAAYSASIVRVIEPDSVTQPISTTAARMPWNPAIMENDDAADAGNVVDKAVIRLPSFEQVRDDKVLYGHASRILHRETNPGNARPLVQGHGDRLVWLNPPPIPLSTEEMDWVFGLPYQRVPHPSSTGQKIPAYEMIRFSVNIMRGCFGGCSFCSITEHEGRIIQSRSEASILNEIENIRDKTPGFTGVVSDLGGPTANMWRLACKDKNIEVKCRRPSCVYPGICKNLDTDQTPLISLYRKARNIQGVKKVLIASGLRYDLAVETPAYVKELVSEHVGGYLKIAPEHTEKGPLSKMMKPGMGTYDAFKKLFDKYSKQAGKEQYLIPYFIAGHPGTTTEDMLQLALWLKANGFRADQVQNFYPSPMASATAMYYSSKNPLKRIDRNNSETVAVAKGGRERRLQKAFLRYHDPDNWPMLRQALKKMGRNDLIGNGKRHLVPLTQFSAARVVQQRGKSFKTQHTGLPTVPGGKPRRRRPGHK